MVYSRFKKFDLAPDSPGAESSRVIVTQPSRIQLKKPLEIKK